MTIQVFYHSSTGNTKKLAEAIAGAAGVKAVPIDANTPAISEPVDLLFIGDGIYAGKPNKHTVRFIESLDPELVKNAAVFATYGGQAKIGDVIAELLKARGLHMIEKPFVCKGQSWGLMNRRHPNADDLNAAVQYAKKAIAQI